MLKFSCPEYYATIDNNDKGLALFKLAREKKKVLGDFKKIPN
jgi:hypothetical protein